MESMIYGCMHVSTKEQCEDRPQYQKMIRRLKPHDILVVKPIDRRGRNCDEILDQWR